MGADVHVQVFGGRPRLVDDLGDELEALEQCWSRFRISSDLNRLNDSAGTRVRVPPLLATALHRARLAWDLTDGRFDPTVHDTLCAAGYRDSFPAVPITRGDLAACRPAAGMADVTVDLERCEVERPEKLRFDLGGIGKGLAADLLATRLVERGAVGACVGMGGDLRVAGAPPPGGWIVPVEDPRSAPHDRPGAAWFEVVLSEGAIVTSTTLFRAWTTESGEQAHHLIDPTSGRPAVTGVDAVIVVAAEAWWAEVLAKSTLLAGVHDGRRLLERHGVTGWIVPTAVAAVAP